MSPAGFPAGTCDTHMHLYDHRHPVAPTAVLRPPDASVADYVRFRHAAGFGAVSARVVVVQPTTYGMDHTVLERGLTEFTARGTAARAVAVVDEHVSQDELQRLHDLGVRGARFHLLPGGLFGWESLQPVAERVAAYGWLVQVQTNGRDLPDRAEALRRLPTPVVVDHVGRFMPPVAPDDAAFRTLLDLVDDGHCWVRLSAPYESAPELGPEYRAVGELARALVHHAPERLLWASNWPHPSLAVPPGPTNVARWASEWMPDDAVRRRIMVDNPVELYGFDPVTSQEDPR